MSAMLEWSELEKKFNDGSLKEYFLSSGNKSLPANIFRIAMENNLNDPVKGIVVIRNILQTAPATMLRDEIISKDIIDWLCSLLLNENSKLTAKAVALGTLSLFLKNCQVISSFLDGIVDVVAHIVNDIAALLEKSNGFEESTTVNGIVMVFHQLEDLLNLVAIKNEAVLIKLHVVIPSVFNILCKSSHIFSKDSSAGLISNHTTQLCVDIAKVFAMVLETYLTNQSSSSAYTLSKDISTVDISFVLQGLNVIIDYTITNTVAHDSFLAAFHNGIQYLCVYAQQQHHHTSIIHTHRQDMKLLIERIIAYISEPAHLSDVLECKRIELMIGIISSFFEKESYALLRTVVYVPFTDDEGNGKGNVNDECYEFIEKYLKMIASLQHQMKESLVKVNTTATRQQLKIIYSDIRKGCIASCEQLFTVDTVWLPCQLSEERLPRLFTLLLKSLNTPSLFPIIYHTINQTPSSTIIPTDTTAERTTTTTTTQEVDRFREMVTVHLQKAAAQFPHYTVSSSEDILLCFKSLWEDDCLLGVPLQHTSIDDDDDNDEKEPARQHNILSLLSLSFDVNIPKLPSMINNTSSQSAGSSKAHKKVSHHTHQAELWKWQISIVSTIESYYQLLNRVVNKVDHTSPSSVIMVDVSVLYAHTLPLLIKYANEFHTLCSINDSASSLSSSRNAHHSVDTDDHSVELKHQLLSVLIAMVDFCTYVQQGKADIIRHHHASVVATTSWDNSAADTCTRIFQVLVKQFFRIDSDCYMDDEGLEHQQLVTVTSSLLNWYLLSCNSEETSGSRRRSDTKANLWYAWSIVIIGSMKMISTKVAQEKLCQLSAVLNFQTVPSVEMKALLMDVGKELLLHQDSIAFEVDEEMIQFYVSSITNQLLVAVENQHDIFPLLSKVKELLASNAINERSWWIQIVQCLCEIV